MEMHREINHGALPRPELTTFSWDGLYDRLMSLISCKTYGRFSIIWFKHFYVQGEARLA